MMLRHQSATDLMIGSRPAGGKKCPRLRKQNAQEQDVRCTRMQSEQWSAKTRLPFPQ